MSKNWKMLWRRTVNWIPFIVFSATLCQASTVVLPFTKLTGLTGGSPAGTAVYRADLSAVALSSILSITIFDNSSGLGGSPGQFSGFDLDAIRISTTSCPDAACAAGLAGLAVFNFSAGTLFTPGVQRAPADPKLFGTDVSGTAVDNIVATLGIFDANSTTAIPGAAGFISMGDNGILTFNLTSAVSPAGKFLYIGEVGDNGEVAAGQIVVRDSVVPEPSTWLLIPGAMVMLGFLRRRALSR
jgi:hypothetical protein